MSVLNRLFASRGKHAQVAAAACSVACSVTCSVVACSTSATVTPTGAPTTTTVAKPATTNTVAPAPPHISALAKDWKAYGGTVYFGCPNEFTVGKTALDDIHPKVLDTATADLITPGVPLIAAGETVTGAACALSNTVGDIKIVYLVTTVKPAGGPDPEITKTTGYLFDLKSNQPLATKELQPPTPDLLPAAAKDWRLAATATGAAWVDAFTDGRGPTSPPRTLVLSNTDLSTLWDDPQPGRVWQDVLSFQRSTVPGGATGAELRAPTGAPVYQNNNIISVDGELSDGPDKLVQLTYRDPQNPAATFTAFLDLTSRSLIKVGDSERISGGGLVATLSDGKLFVDGRGSDSSQFGFGVWNLRTQHWDLLKDREEAKKLPIAKLAYFGDHLYVTNSGNTFSVLALPETNPVASNWSGRPFGRISGWTLVCRGETAPSQAGDCKEIVLVQDADGRYPGPWF